MKDLQRRYLMFKESMPEHGDVIIMWYAVNKQDYSKRAIQAVFNLWVSKDEYEQCDKEDIINYLFSYTKRQTTHK